MHVSGFYQQDCGCKMIMAAASDCLVHLVSNTFTMLVVWIVVVR